MATYYVATTGNDGWAGTIGSPWLTLNRATEASELVAGDICYVRGGVYNGRATVYLINGSSDNPIIFRNYPGESPIIDGTGISISQGGSLFQIYGNYIHLIGLEIRNGDTGSAAGVITTGHHTLISQCVIHDMLQNAVIMVQDADYSITEYVTAYNLCMSNSDGIYSSGEIWGTGISAARYPDYCIIRHCTVHDVWGEGISTYEATNTTIEDNIVYNHYSVGIYVSDATDCLVQRNLVYNTHIVGDYNQAGFGHWPEGRTPANARNTFINNIAYGCPAGFVSLSGDNLTVLNNTFVNATVHANIRLEGTQTNSVFKNNIIIQEDGLSIIESIGAHPGLTFSNNLWSKTPDADAVGAGDVVSALNISKNGTYDLPAYYKLLSNSAAINAGTDVGVDDDFEGNARDANPDIGAFEYTGDASISSPTVTTDTITDITSTTATGGGNVTNDGGGTVTARGVCWSTSASPTTADSHTSDGTGTGVFTSDIINLSAGLTYYVRAYATNSAGTSYGNQVSFDAASSSAITYLTSAGHRLIYEGHYLMVS